MSPVNSQITQNWIPPKTKEAAVTPDETAVIMLTLSLHPY